MKTENKNSGKQSGLGVVNGSSKTMVFAKCPSNFTIFFMCLCFCCFTLNHEWNLSHMVASVRHFGYSRSCLFWWRHRFQIASFSPSTLQNSVLKMHRLQISPLWRAFSNGSVFGDPFRRCSVDDSCIRSKTAPFSFESGLVAKVGIMSLGSTKKRTWYFTSKCNFISSSGYSVKKKYCDAAWVCKIHINLG